MGTLALAPSPSVVTVEGQSSFDNSVPDSSSSDQNTSSNPNWPDPRALQSFALTPLPLFPRCLVVSGGGAGEVERRAEGMKLPTEMGQETCGGAGEAVWIGMEEGR